MNATCLYCGRPAKSGHATNCNGCSESSLYRWETAERRAQYQCPATLQVVDAGGMGHQLDRPYRVVWQKGADARGHRVTRPAPRDVPVLDRTFGLVLGPGCVIYKGLRPREDHPWPHMHGLVLEPVIRTLAAALTVNQPLEYQECAACSKRVPVVPGAVMGAEWTARERVVPRGPIGRRQLVRTRTGPHPAGTVACTLCRRTSD